MVSSTETTQRSVLVHWSLLCLAGVLFAVIVAIPAAHPGAGIVTMRRSLAEELPTHVAGWQIRTLPLASGKHSAAAVRSILGCDDAIVREYKNGDAEIVVYVAYWLPFRVSVFEPEEHTPDACWPQDNWRCVESSDNVKFAVAGLPVLPARTRIFTRGDESRHVYFWHVAGRKAFLRRDWWIGGQTATAWDLRSERNREQFFVRISSCQPLAQLWNTPVMESIMHKLGELALYQER